LIRYDVKKPLGEWLDGPVTGQVANPMQVVALKPNFTSRDCQKELQRLASLRNCLADAIPKFNAHRNALDDFALRDGHEYHATLLEFEKRHFPHLEGVAPNLRLEWRDAYDATKDPVAHSSLSWDRVCTLWNIAALESFEASLCDSDKEGRKSAFQHSQAAACAMVYTQKAMEGEIFEGLDLSNASLVFWEKAMRAQAQMAAYEMSSKSGEVKQVLLSYLAMGAVTCWNEALQASQDPLLQSALDKHKEYGATCKGWSLLLLARAETHQALSHRETKELGMEISRLRQAKAAARSALEFCRKTTEIETSAVEKLSRFIEQRLTEVERDNIIVGDDIPSSSPTIRSHVMVKTDLPMPESMTKPKVSLFAHLKT